MFFFKDEENKKVFGRRLKNLSLLAAHLRKRLICKLLLDVGNNKLFEQIMTDFHLDKKKYSI